MTRWIEGIVSSLRCEGGGHITPHLTFSGDTDMVTAELTSLSSVTADEIVVAEMIDGELEDFGSDAVQTRVNNLLARDDLRIVRLRRVEAHTAPTGVSFQEFRQTYIPPRLIFACPQCGSDALAYREATPTQYRQNGGTLTVIADLELRDGN
jgi:hypothetical protein